MAIEFGAKQKTIIGIHNKNKNSFSISKKEFVIPDNEDQSIFLL